MINYGKIRVHWSPIQNVTISIVWSWNKLRMFKRYLVIYAEWRAMEIRSKSLPKILISVHVDHQNQSITSWVTSRTKRQTDRQTEAKTSLLSLKAIPDSGSTPGASIPMGQGGHVPPIFGLGGHYHECRRPNISRVISATFYPCNIFLISWKSF